MMVTARLSAMVSKALLSTSTRKGSDWISRCIDSGPRFQINDNVAEAVECGLGPRGNHRRSLRLADDDGACHWLGRQHATRNDRCSDDAAIFAKVAIAPSPLSRTFARQLYLSDRR